MNGFEMNEDASETLSGRGETYWRLRGPDGITEMTGWIHPHIGDSIRKAIELYSLALDVFGQDAIDALIALKGGVR